MSAEQQRYSKEELKEFEELLNKKIAKAKDELDHLKVSITQSDTGADSNHSSVKTLEDGADALEKEQLNQLAARTMKFLKQNEDALIRIKNGTYGICIDTGNLIRKERLRAVPHTQHSIDAKLKKRK